MVPRKSKNREIEWFLCVVPYVLDTMPLRNSGPSIIVLVCALSLNGYTHVESIALC